MPQVVVNTKSPFASTVNWAAGLTALASTLSELLPFLPLPYSHYATIAIIVIGGVTTIYLRTFQTASVLTTSLQKIPSVTSEQAQTAALNNAQLKGTP